MTIRAVDLITADLPRDDEAEQFLLSLLVPHLVAPTKPKVFQQVSPEDFYLGRLSFHGWLYGMLERAWRQTKEPKGRLAWALSKTNRKDAAKHGCKNLPAELYWLAGFVHSDIREAKEYVRRIKNVAKRRAKAQQLAKELMKALRYEHPKT